MRGALSSLINWLQDKTVLHPAAAVLAASLDGELPETERARINGHLSRCGDCRDRLEQLRAALRLYEETIMTPAAGFPLEQGLQQLRAAMQAWNEQQLDSPEAAALSPAICERLVRELSIYLGLPTARKMLQRCNHPGVQGAEVAAAIEPVVAGFFGRQTASAVATKVARICHRAQLSSVPARPPS